MKFYSLIDRTPHDGDYCVIKEPLTTSNERKMLSVFPQPQFYHQGDSGSGFLYHPSVVQWALVPQHVKYKRAPWSSEYWGDDLPSRDCDCLVCTQRNDIVRIARFDARRQQFLGHTDVIAFAII